MIYGYKKIQNIKWSLEGVVQKIGVEKVRSLVDSTSNVISTLIEEKGIYEIIYKNDSNIICLWNIPKTKRGLTAEINKAVGSSDKSKQLEGEIARYIVEKIGIDEVECVSANVANFMKIKK